MTTYKAGDKVRTKGGHGVIIRKEKKPSNAGPCITGRWLISFKDGIRPHAEGEMNPRFGGNCCQECGHVLIYNRQHDIFLCEEGHPTESDTMKDYYKRF